MIQIDYQDKRPLYEQITEKLQNLIVRGVLEVDTKLPSVRNFAIDLSINPNTIQRVYQELERMGFIYTIKGRGNYVADESVWKSSERQNMKNELKQIVGRLIDLGITSEQLSDCINSIYKGETE